MKKIIFYLAIFSALSLSSNVSATSYIYTEEKMEDEKSSSKRKS